MQPFLYRFFATLLAFSFYVFAFVPVGLAISPSELGASPPEALVLDEANVFSRASRNEVEAKLRSLEDQRVKARLLTLRRLDYGYSLKSFGEELLASWSESSETPLLLILIETQNKRAALIADSALQAQLPETLLTSTAQTTMTLPLRDGDRYRQSSIDGLTRLSIVLAGGEDPGPPTVIERVALPTNIPTKIETEDSNATTWIIILLVAGSIIPMATWWVFSR
ncbi:TPM domain-containing protein [Synechococcus sp. M16CYN]|uniref:photosystem II repair protein Psb32 n=1 Tax=Synechococcus sp. M16CYN TaxID=3103139 RepID=UPI00324E6871